MKLYLDDIRDAPVGWELVRTVADFKRTIIMNEDLITMISFDHDLGENLIKNGLFCVVWLIEGYPEFVKRLGPTGFLVHSMNPVGRRNIENALYDFFYREFDREG